MTLSFQDFCDGLASQLPKKANFDEQLTIPNSYTNHSGSVFPSIGAQTKWRYAKGEGKLQLHDGNVIHQFEYSNGGAFTDDFPMTKVEDISYFDFGKGLSQTGTAQVHKADPTHIYMTLHDGKSNPTLTLKQVSGSNWRASPKQTNKKACEIDMNEFRRGLTDKIGILDTLLKGIHHGSNMATDGLMSIGRNPLAAAGVGLGLGAAYDIGKRTLYNNDEENAQESFTDRALRYVAPSAGLGLLGAGVGSLSPNRIKFTPAFDAGNPKSYRSGLMGQMDRAGDEFDAKLSQ